jgi:hypothetical protein
MRLLYESGMNVNERAYLRLFFGVCPFVYKGYFFNF